MAICPECHAVYGDEVQVCPEHGSALVPDDLLAVTDEVLLPPGTMVGEYRIERKLGAGTFGDVYAGEQPLIGKRVAVKVLNQRFASDPVIVSRFVAEARAVNRIRQRNIIDIFSFGVLPGLERHYFVMELLDGLTLAALMEATGRLPVATVLSIVRGIADALDAVHEAGITHRDLKPDNVFLATERDGTYFPKLLDFGIAKLIDDEGAHRTGPGMVLGTPRYMSPEQARGRPIDRRTDIYALGVMIHEMLTGAPLFAGDSSVDILLRHTSDAVPPLSSVCADLPPALDAPVLAMLAKKPEDRPSSAGEAVAALAAVAQQLGLDRRDAVAARGPGVVVGAALTPEGLAQFQGTTLAAAPPAEALAVETSSGITPREKSGRWKVALGALALLALGLTAWSLGRAPRVEHAAAAGVELPSVTVAPSVAAPPLATIAEPTVVPVQPEIAAPSSRPRPAVPLKPAASARPNKIDRLLEGRD